MAGLRASVTVVLMLVRLAQCQAVMGSGCGGPRFRSSTSGSISSMNYPYKYSPLANCSWFITVPLGYFVKLQFDAKFDLERCYDTVNVTGYGRFCGTTAPAEKVMYTNKVSVTFTSDISTQLTGFSLTWTAIHADHGGCGDSVQTGMSGSITSMNYPKSYVANANCVWRIEVPQGYRVLLHFNGKFDLETSHDPLTVYIESLASVSYGPYSGTSAPPDILSEDNDIIVTFKSDGTTQKEGFNITWTAVRPGCDSPKYPTGTSGTIASMNYPNGYYPSSTCTWVIKPAPGYRLRIHFNQIFHVELSSDCYKDHIITKQGNRITGTFCGSTAPPDTFHPPGSAITVNFESDKSNEYKGFFATWTTFSAVMGSGCGGPRFLSSKNGTISSMNYPNKYSNSASCSWIITVPLGYYITLQFDANFALESCGDIVTVYGYGRFCGTTAPADKVLYTNEGNVTFASDSGTALAGFSLTWTAIHVDHGGCGDRVQTGMSGSITSMNYPNSYDARANCVWRIEVPLGYRVLLHFNGIFNVQATNDHLTVYEQSLTSVSYGPFSGTSVPPDILSHDTDLIVTFKSNNNDQREGFNITWTAVQPASRKFGTNNGYTCHCLLESQCDSSGACPNGHCAQGWYGEYCQTGNSAYSRPTAQSSTYGAHSATAADKAVDNNRNQLMSGGSCTHTADPPLDNQPWWRVDLGLKFALLNLTLYNRGNDGCESYASCKDRLKNFKIWMTDIVDTDPTKGTICLSYPGTVSLGVTQQLTCDPPAVGRYLYIKLMDNNTALSLCEVVIHAFQYRVCSGQKYGPNCNNRCRCTDRSEQCNSASGACTSKCMGEFDGKYCEKLLPYTKHAPIVNSQTGSSISISTPAWSKVKDGGDGTVVKYKLQYKEKSSSQWINLTTEYPTSNIASSSWNVTGLKDLTVYQFRVVLSNDRTHAKDQAWGRPGAELEARTLCPPIVTPKITEITTGIDTTKSWPRRAYLLVKMENFTSAGMPSVCFKNYYVYGNHERGIAFKTQTFEYKIESLLAYTNNRVYIELYDKDGRKGTSKTVVKKTAEDIPDKVANLRSTQQGKTLKVTWSPPTRPYGVITAYRVEHKLSGYGDCKMKVDGAATFSPVLTADKRSYVIPDNVVCPYCRYNITVRVATAVGQGIPAELTNQITPAAAPTATPPTPVVNAKAARDISFRWTKILCKDKNGPKAWYTFQVLKPSWEQFAKSTTNGIQILIPWLSPYTAYRFRIAYTNSAGIGPYSANVTAKTNEDFPRAPYITKAGAKLDSISIRVTPPDPPHAKIIGYTIEIRLSATNRDRRNVSIIIAEQLIHTFDKLTKDTEYTFRAKAWSSKGYGGWSTEISIRAIEGLPGSPMSIKTVTATVSGLRLRWIEPRFTNGVLKNYKLTCTPVFSYNKLVNGNREKYKVQEAPSPNSKEIDMKTLVPATEYSCSLEAQTSVGYGSPITVSNWTKSKREDEIPKAWVSSAKVEKSTTTTITFSINELKEKELRYGKVKAVLIGIKLSSAENLQKRRKRATVLTAEEHTSLTGYKAAKKSGQTSYIAAELPADYTGSFVIGDNKNYGGYYNPPLVSGETYNILLGVVTTAGGFSAISFTRLDEEVRVGRQKISIVVAVGVPIAILIVLVAVIVPVVLFIRRRRKNTPDEPAGEDTSEYVELEHVYDKPLEEGSSDAALESIYDELHAAGDASAYATVLPVPSSSGRSIPCSEILKYIKGMRKDGSRGFKEEFQKFPTNLVRPCVTGQLPQNKSQNRLPNIVAYDHSRVVLKPVTPKDKVNNDYINANFIDGYDKKKSFIASQGPTDSNVVDMWRMIWHEKCAFIVMLTNIKDESKEQCAQYWPTAESVRHGPFKVQLQKEDSFTDYVKRTMKVSLNGESRLVTQYQLTVWSEDGVPQFASTLLNFRAAVMKENGENYGCVPMFIHCSTGVGRTGTFIAIDYLIRQGRAEKKIDVYGCVLALSGQRPNTVKNVGQYEYIHDAVADYFLVGVTNMISGSFPEKYKKLTTVPLDKSKCKLEEQYTLMAAFSLPVVHAQNVTTDYADRNRDPNIIPEKSSRPVLSVQEEGCDDYINAVYLSGYGDKDNYIATQMPFPHTLKDFWRLVDDMDISTIVMMNTVKEYDKLCPSYWPKESEQLVFGRIVVEGRSEDTSHASVTVRYFDISKEAGSRGDCGKPVRTVCQFHLQNWPDGKATPANPATVIDLLEMVEKWQQQIENKKILVQCLDGASQSGVFCTAHSVIEKVKVDHRVDVFQFARLLRTNRPQLLNTYEQYKFVHDVVLHYLGQFDTYANFL